ncbi:MAG: tRNA-dihydrouridine synthase [Candidatus Saccharimonadales bacterium]
MNVWSDLTAPLFILAPMDDVTDTVFRQIVHSCAPADVYFTEFVNVDGLQSPGRPNLLKKLRFVASEGPLIAQIWGLKPENFYKTAAEIVDGTFARELGLPDGFNFAGIDINMGCPAKSEVKNGTCSALINDKPRAAEIIEATQAGANNRLPVSVKTRLGFSTVDMTWPEFLLGHDLAALTMHGRTRKQMSKVPADWDKIGEVRELRDKISPDTKIIGNGDVRDRNHGLELINKYKLDGVMIGRGVFADPFVFASPNPWESWTKQQRLDLYRRQVELFGETWQDHERPIHTLNKFCKIYVSGFDGAKELREKLMSSITPADAVKYLTDAMG